MTAALAVILWAVAVGVVALVAIVLVGAVIGIVRFLRPHAPNPPGVEPPINLTTWPTPRGPR